MNQTFRLLLVVIAMALFAIATWRPALPERDRLVSAGLFFWVASTITWT